MALDSTKQSYAFLKVLDDDAKEGELTYGRHVARMEGLCLGMFGNRHIARRPRPLMSVIEDKLQSHSIRDVHNGYYRITELGKKHLNATEHLVFQ